MTRYYPKITRRKKPEEMTDEEISDHCANDRKLGAASVEAVSYLRHQCQVFKDKRVVASFESGHYFVRVYAVSIPLRLELSLGDDGKILITDADTGDTIPWKHKDTELDAISFDFSEHNTSGLDVLVENYLDRANVST